jgi:DNA invertase Pin-like site-specific DNA recombinase
MLLSASGDVNWYTPGSATGGRTAQRFQSSSGWLGLVSQTCPRSALDAQIAKVRTLAEAAGKELKEIVEDSGESALKLERPALLKVLAAVAESRVDSVIVGDLDRLARDPEDLRRIQDSFSSSGVVVLHGLM